MPELPEVQTTVDGINAVAKGRTIVHVWTDIAVTSPSLPQHHHTTKSKRFFVTFKSAVIGTKILKAERRAKNIFVHLSGGNTIWIHLKMTGHMMYGTYIFDTKIKQWVPDPDEKNDALRDPFNRFLHTVFILDNGKHLVLSDVRKFAKVTMFPTAQLDSVIADMKLGPEPLSKYFTSAICTEQLLKRPNMTIKLALLDQTLIAGIGNIYSDEALWRAGIHPLRNVGTLTKPELKKLYESIIIVLKKGIDFGGDSTSDYRDITGKRGNFQGAHEAYRRTGKACQKKACRGIIMRIPFGTRNAHYCPVHQK